MLGNSSWMMAACMALGVTALAATTGCDGKIAQCNRLIDVINKEQGPLKNTTGSDPAALKKLADTLGEVATKVKAVTLKDEKLVGFRDEYAKMAEDLATAAKDTAGAFEANDAKKADDAAKQMRTFGPRETKLVNDINGYCSGGG